jgi:hypothetical protein
MKHVKLILIFLALAFLAGAAYTFYHRSYGPRIIFQTTDAKTGLKLVAVCERCASGGGGYDLDVDIYNYGGKQISRSRLKACLDVRNDCWESENEVTGLILDSESQHLTVIFANSKREVLPVALGGSY